MNQDRMRTFIQKVARELWLKEEIDYKQIKYLGREALEIINELQRSESFSKEAEKEVKRIRPLLKGNE